MARFCVVVKDNLLLVCTSIAVVLGVFLGFALRPLNLSPETLQLINFPGEIFMQVLKMMILPLIFSSLISALAQMDARESGQMGLATVLYYLTTTVLATILGIILVLSIHPGDPSVKEGLIDDGPVDTDVSPLDTFLDLARNTFPENIIQATFMRVQTVYEKQKIPLKKNSSAPIIKMVPKIRPTKGMNILGIIVFCTGFGIVISSLGERARIVVDFFVILDAVIMRWVETLMWFAPLGIVCLIASNLLELEDLSDAAQVLLMYVITVMAGFILHMVVTMPGLYFLITRKNPLLLVKGILQALVTGFGTASSGAALPLSMQCLEDKLGVDRRVTRFVLPLGSTINMDGNALYEAVAVIFIAQLNNVTLSIAEVITVSITATIASIGLGSVPAGLVSILLILSTVGLPTKDIPLLFTVDWLLDRVRTVVNILGDAFASGAIEHLLKERLAIQDTVRDFRTEIKEEIELLKSVANSRRPSISGYSEAPSSHDFFINSALVHDGAAGVLSRRDSLVNSGLSWRHAFFDNTYTPQRTYLV